MSWQNDFNIFWNIKWIVVDIMNKKSHYGAFIIPHSDKSQSQSQNHGMGSKSSLMMQLRGCFHKLMMIGVQLLWLTHLQAKRSQSIWMPKRKALSEDWCGFFGAWCEARCLQKSGVLRALERGISAILFNDSDDMSHPKRLETTKRMFLANHQIGLIYHPLR